MEKKTPLAEKAVCQLCSPCALSGIHIMEREWPPVRKRRKSRHMSRNALKTLGLRFSQQCRKTSGNRPAMPDKGSYARDYG